MFVTVNEWAPVKWEIYLVKFYAATTTAAADDDDEDDDDVFLSPSHCHRPANALKQTLLRTLYT